MSVALSERGSTPGWESRYRTFSYEAKRGSGFGRAVGTRYPAQRGHHDASVRILVASGAYHQEGPPTLCFLTLEEVPWVLIAVKLDVSVSHTLTCVCSTLCRGFRRVPR